MAIILLAGNMKELPFASILKEASDVVKPADRRILDPVTFESEGREGDVVVFPGLTLPDIRRVNIRGGIPVQYIASIDGMRDEFKRCLG
jgi:hypothetical protein